jgi:hypothetical protein
MIGVNDHGESEDLVSNAGMLNFVPMQSSPSVRKSNPG